MSRARVMKKFAKLAKSYYDGSLAPHVSNARLRHAERALERSPRNQRLMRKVIEGLRKSRKYAGFFHWPDKRIRELGVAVAFVATARNSGVADLLSPTPSTEDPPDVVARTQNGNLVAIELVELVDERLAAQGRKPSRLFRMWTEPDLQAALERLVREKDSKTFHGGPYSKILLVIHCDEPTADEAKCERALVHLSVDGLQQIDEAYLLLSYRGAVSMGASSWHVDTSNLPLFRIRTSRLGR